MSRRALTSLFGAVLKQQYQLNTYTGEFKTKTLDPLTFALVFKPLSQGIAFIHNFFSQRREDEDEDEDVASDVASDVAGEVAEGLQPEVKGLGERLNAKLTQEKAAFSAKLSNFSCVLQELNIVDKVSAFVQVPIL